MKKLILLVLVVLTFTGCASMFTGTTQTIVFSAPEGTKIFMDGMKIAEVPPGYDAVSVRVGKRLSGAGMVAKKEGYQDTHFFLRTRVNGVVFVNILLGPVFWVGGIVDLATGAAAKMPNYVEVEMAPLAGTTPVSTRDTSLDYLLEF